MWYETDKEGNDSEDDSGQQFIVAEDESESSIDIVDVLSECPPEADRLTANPYRESYRIALPPLPKQIEDISALSIPTTKLVALVKLAQEVQRESIADVVTSIEKLGIDGKVEWEKYDSAISEHSVSCGSGTKVSDYRQANIYEQELIADCLSTIFKTSTIS
jgi:hypothetical protein